MVAPSNVAADQLALQADRAAALAFGTGATAQRLKVVRYQEAGKVAAQEVVAHNLSLTQMVSPPFNHPYPPLTLTGYHTSVLRIHKEDSLGQ